MTFSELQVGQKFIIIRENDEKQQYEKLSNTPHYNTQYLGSKRKLSWDNRISIHGKTVVREIK